MSADDLSGLCVICLRHVASGEFSTSSSSPSSGWSCSTCGGVFIPSSSGQMFHQIKFGQASHTGSQPSSVLRQSTIATRETRSRMHGGHSLFFCFHPHHLQTPKMSRACLVCMGNKALATRTACLTVLLDKAFLARLLISFLITCSAFRFTPRANPAFKP